MNNRNYNSQSGNGNQKVAKIRCSGCGKKKEPELFSKRQRKENENARCMACVKKDEDAESD